MAKNGSLVTSTAVKSKEFLPDFSYFELERFLDIRSVQATTDAISTENHASEKRCSHEIVHLCETRLNCSSLLLSKPSNFIRLCSDSVYISFRQ